MLASQAPVGDIFSKKFDFFRVLSPAGGYFLQKSSSNHNFKQVKKLGFAGRPLPTMTVVPMLSELRGSDGAYATGITVATLAASIVTIPVVAMLTM